MWKIMMSARYERPMKLALRISELQLCDFPNKCRQLQLEHLIDETAR
jgi:hypothetical protein